MAKKAISVIERRLQGASALQTPSAPIPLKEKGWTLRWENNEVRTDQVHHCVTVLGWEYVSPEDIDCALEDLGASARDGRVVRGERGKEVLLKMTEANFKKVQRMKTQENVKSTFNSKIIKETVLNQVGSEHGSEAADFIQRSGMSVTDSRERVSLDE